MSEKVNPGAKHHKHKPEDDLICFLIIGIFIKEKQSKVQDSIFRNHHIKNPYCE